MWGSHVGDGGRGDGAAHSGGLWSVAEETVYPVDEERWDIEVMEFPDHLVTLDGIEGGAEIDEEESGEVTWDFKVLLGGGEGGMPLRLPSLSKPCTQTGWGSGAV